MIVKCFRLAMLILIILELSTVRSTAQSPMPREVFESLAAKRPRDWEDWRQLHLAVRPYGRGAVPTLLALRGQRQFGLYASQALLYLPPQDVIPECIRLLDEGGLETGTAATQVLMQNYRSLSEIRSHPLIPRLICTRSSLIDKSGDERVDMLRWWRDDGEPSASDGWAPGVPQNSLRSTRPTASPSAEARAAQRLIKTIRKMEGELQTDGDYDALEALAKLRSREALPTLVTMLHTRRIEGSTAVASAVALGKIGDPRAIPALVAKANLREENTWIYVTEALGMMCDVMPSHALKKRMVDCGAHPDIVAAALDYPLRRHDRPQPSGNVESSTELAVDATQIKEWELSPYEPQPKTADPETIGRDHTRFLFAVRKAAERSQDSPAAITEVLKLTRHADTGVCSFALLTLSGLRSPEATERLVEALRDGDEVFRCQAALNLGARRAGAQSPAVRPLLEDKSPLVRSAAAWALGKMGDKASVPLLRECLRDQSPLVQVNALRALVDLQGQNLLADLARESPHFSEKARVWLRDRIVAGGRELEPLLRFLPIEGHFGDPGYWRPVHSWIQIVEKEGRPSDIPALYQLVKREKGSHRMPPSGAGVPGGRPYRQLDSNLAWRANDVLFTLLRRWRDRLPLQLITQILVNPEMNVDDRLHFVYEIREERYLPVLRRLMYSHDVDIALWAAIRASRFGEGNCDKVLEKWLRNWDDLEWVIRTRSEEWDTLFEVWAKTDPPRAWSYVRTLCHSIQPEVRAAGMRVVGVFHNTKARSLLQAGLADADCLVRETAGRSMLNQRDHELLRFLPTLLESLRLRRFELWDTADQVFERLGKRYPQQIRSLLRNNDPDVRYFARRALSERRWEAVARTGFSKDKTRPSPDMLLRQLSNTDSTVSLAAAVELSGRGDEQAAVALLRELPRETERYLSRLRKVETEERERIERRNSTRLYPSPPPPEERSVVVAPECAYTPESIPMATRESQAPFATTTHPRGEKWRVGRSCELGYYEDLWFVRSGPQTKVEERVFAGLMEDGYCDKMELKWLDENRPCVTVTSGRDGPLKTWTFDLRRLREDRDGDGATDVVEDRLCTDPTRPDTDGDGILDAQDRNPLVGVTPNTDGTVIKQMIFSRLVREKKLHKQLVVVVTRGRQAFTGYDGTILCLTPEEVDVWRRKFRQQGAQLIFLPEPCLNRSHTEALLFPEEYIGDLGASGYQANLVKVRGTWRMKMWGGTWIS